MSQNIVPGELFVGFHVGIMETDIQKVLRKRAQGARIRRLVFPSSGLYLVEVPVGQEEDLAQALEKDSRVQYAHPNFIGDPM